MNNKISLLVLCKNESKNLREWGRWIHQINTINEIVFIDDESTDNSLEIIKSFENKNLKIKTFIHQLNNNFSQQRNFAISKCTNNNIFWLDPDETPSPELISFLNNFSDSKTNYSFKRNDVFIGHQLRHGETANLNFIRLFNKKSGKFVGDVHETWQSTIPTTKTNLIIFHQSHQTLNSFFEKINFYSTIRAQELFDQNIKTNLFLIIFYPKIKFIQNYFFRLGFLDGTAGIIFALGMSFHSFLVRAKLWKLLHP